MKNSLSWISAAVSVVSLLVAVLAVATQASFWGLDSLASAMAAAAGVALVAALIKMYAVSSELRDLKALSESYRAEVKENPADRFKVFISYASEDYPRVRKLAEELRQQGFEIWLDREALMPGDNWVAAIERAIEDSDAIVSVISGNSVDRGGVVRSELKYPIDMLKSSQREEIPLIPVMLDKARIPSDLEGIRYIDGRGPDGPKRAAGVLAELRKKKNSGAARAK